MIRARTRGQARARGAATAAAAAPQLTKRIMIQQK
jgi:hypothetical protein